MNGSCLWGYGFVLRYFVGFVDGLWMKRWRCPDCDAVHTARPPEYCPGVQYPRSLQQITGQAAPAIIHVGLDLLRPIPWHTLVLIYDKELRSSITPEIFIHMLRAKR